MKKILEHKWALLTAFIIGLIALAPHIIFPLQLGEEYKGIYMMQTANETEYLARIKEITDGHWKLGSVPFYEYKNNPPLMPPNILDFLYAGAHFLSGISISNLVIISKFFLPALFFLLIYFFIHQLTKSKEFLSNKINAISGGLLIVLGYDIVDYGSLISYIKGVSSPSDFLLWTRPINPILGGMLIFGFLLIFWKLYRNDATVKKSKYLIFSAGLLFALAIMSYFFSWGIILSFLAVFGLVSLISKNWILLKKVCLVAFLGILFSVPYLYNIYLATKNPIYKESAIRTGIFYGREMLINKFLILALFIFLAVSVAVFYARKKEIGGNFFKEKWWLICLAMIICSFIALNQQLLTGQTVWPYHFVQYTIPLSIAAIFIALYNFSFYSGFLKKTWMAISFIAIAGSLSFGAYNQAMAYKNNFASYNEKQKYAAIFDWINKNAEKDCVILTEDKVFLNKFLLIYTNCNVYFSDFNSFMMPNERLYHNYMTFLKLKGVNENNITEYVEKNAQDVAVHFYGAEGLRFNSSSPSFLVVKDKFINNYEKFLEEDFMEKLKKYKVDYFMVESSKKYSFLKEDTLYSSDNFSIYSF